MQSHDEDRHFLRACQIAAGQPVSQVDVVTGQVGGVLPIAEADFVRDKLSTDFLRQEDSLHTIRARLTALERWAEKQRPFTEQRFAAFPSSAVYPAALYLPQVIGIRVATAFTQKVFIVFYAARIFNAIIAIAIISLALYCASEHQYLLLLPAVLPISLYQIASVSSDAGMISLSILFVGLCLRFEHYDSRGLRLCLFVSLLLITLGKPVYLPAALLLLTSRNRLGWKRAAAFCLKLMAVGLVSYMMWSYVVRSFLITPLPISAGSAPLVQIHSLTAHPGAVVSTFAATLAHRGWTIWFDMIGVFGWGGLPLPTWFYMTTSLIALAIIVCLVANVKVFDQTRLALVLVAAILISLAVFTAAYVLWTPPGSFEVLGLQGRYFIPLLVVCLFVAPPLRSFGKYSRACLCTLSIGFFFISAWWTTRTVGAYYFPQSTLVGQNVHKLFRAGPVDSCPASLDQVRSDLLAFLEGGRTTLHDTRFRVILTDSAGAIIGESDPRLIGNDPNEWRANIWMPNSSQRIDSWLVQGTLACSFAQIEVKPPTIPTY